ncbi:hypothetical protein OH77DRAFT_1593974 [Trametes cingulata]|nr:hypothetical protein OH77DRAFT_1593974 [Trametes cingulata]
MRPMSVTLTLPESVADFLTGDSDWRKPSWQWPLHLACKSVLPAVASGMLAVPGVHVPYMLKEPGMVDAEHQHIFEAILFTPKDPGYSRRVVCKVAINDCRDREGCRLESLRDEAELYQDKLSTLQGLYVPRFIGFFEGSTGPDANLTVACLILEYVGDFTRDDNSEMALSDASGTSNASEPSNAYEPSNPSDTSDASDESSSPSESSNASNASHVSNRHSELQLCEAFDTLEAARAERREYKAKCAETLLAIHQAGVLHGNLSAESFIPEGDKVFIVGFGEESDGDHECRKPPELTLEAGMLSPQRATHVKCAELWSAFDKFQWWITNYLRLSSELIDIETLIELGQAGIYKEALVRRRNVKWAKRDAENLWSDFNHLKRVHGYDFILSAVLKRKAILAAST